MHPIPDSMRRYLSELIVLDDRPGRTGHTRRISAADINYPAELRALGRRRLAEADDAVDDFEAAYLVREAECCFARADEVERARTEASDRGRAA